MKKRPIDPAEAAGTMIKALKPGILLTAKADGVVNSMTIGWATTGINWSKPVFVTYVRRSRFTRQLLDKNPEFTINVPVNEPLKDILAFCGTKSGRDVNKIEACGLTPVEGSTVSVPALKEFPLTLECKVIYRQIQEEGLYTDEIRDKQYPLDENGERDVHIAYFGEITDAYIIED